MAYVDDNATLGEVGGEGLDDMLAACDALQALCVERVGLVFNDKGDTYSEANDFSHVDPRNRPKSVR